MDTTIKIPADLQPLALRGPWFVEPETNRVLLLRGVNLSGGTKLPCGITSHERDRFWVDYDRHVSFVGRPFSLEDADEHLDRLKDWGFTFLRFVVTWEALEHEGPGIYDYDYIEYVVQVLKKCKQRGIRVFIDPHQDVWSRQSGGSGHPGWTLTLAGLNPSNFAATNAALVHNTYSDLHTFPKMVWSTNYNKLAAATMFTLFWAGATFAPHCVVDGVNIQEYLQSHFINAILTLTRRIHDETDDCIEDCVVVGYDTMNEPGHGYIAYTDLSKFPEEQDLKKDLSPTPFESLQLGVGLATTVEVWDFGGFGPQKKGTTLVDPKGTSAWLTDAELADAQSVFGWSRSSSWPSGCIWATHDVWSPPDRTLLKPSYFATDPATGRDVKFDDFWMSFVTRYTDAIRQVHEKAIIFVQPAVMEVPPQLPEEMGRVVYTPHWYDGLTLINKEWKSWNVDYVGLKRGKYGEGVFKYVRALKVGEKAVRECFVEQLGMVKGEGSKYIGDYPCLIGEIGIPYDMKGSTTSNLFNCYNFFASADSITAIPISSVTSPQSKAMDANLHALESNLLNFTLWNYVPDNDSEWGDQWNGEDLSLWQEGEEQGWEQGKSMTMARSESQEPLMGEEGEGAEATVVIVSPEKMALHTSTEYRPALTVPQSALTFLSPRERVVVTDDSDADSAYTVTTLASDLLHPGIGNEKKLSLSASTSATTVAIIEPEIKKLDGRQPRNARDIPPIHRPYPAKTAGIPLFVSFVMQPHARFEFRFHGSNNGEITGYAVGPTEIYVPKYHFPVPSEAEGEEDEEPRTEVSVSDGEWRVLSEGVGHWVLGWWAEEGEENHKIVIEKRGGKGLGEEEEDGWGGWGCTIL